MATQSTQPQTWLPSLSALLGGKMIANRADYQLVEGWSWTPLAEMSAVHGYPLGRAGVAER